MSRAVAAARRALICVVPLGAVLAPARAAAQTTASIEAGVTRVHYGGDEAIALAAVSPFVQLDRPDGWIAATATVSAFEGGGWGLQGTVTGSRFLPVTAGFRPELAGVVEASRAEDGTRAGEAAGRVRMHWLGIGEGVWGGGAVGVADGLTGSRTVRSIDFGAWVRREPLTAVLTVEPEWIGDTARLIDAEALARLVRGPLEIAVFGGVRHQRRPVSASARWGGVTAAWWFRPTVAATVAVGSYPADLARDFGAGRYTTLSVRLANRRPDPPERADQPAYRLLPPLAQPAVAAFTVEPGATPASRRLVVRAPGARGVDIMGDFTDWHPTPLRGLGGGRWAVELPLAPGVHRLNIRVTGGDWGVPPGIPIVRDDFSGVVGLLTIP